MGELVESSLCTSLASELGFIVLFPETRGHQLLDELLALFQGVVCNDGGHCAVLVLEVVLILPILRDGFQGTGRGAEDLARLPSV